MTMTVSSPVRSQLLNYLLTQAPTTTTPCPEKRCTLFLPVTLRNANRFSKFFYRHTLLKFAVNESINILP